MSMSAPYEEAQAPVLARTAATLTMCGSHMPSTTEWQYQVTCCVRMHALVHDVTSVYEHVHPCIRLLVSLRIVCADIVRIVVS